MIHVDGFVSVMQMVEEALMNETDQRVSILH